MYEYYDNYIWIYWQDGREGWLWKLSNDKIQVKEGTLYPILYRLVDEGYISDQKVLVGKRLTRVHYHIESKGEE